SYSEGADSRDGAENAANGLIFGWFYARAMAIFGEQSGPRHWVLRQQSARKVVDVEVFEKTFHRVDEFAEYLIEIGSYDFRLPSPLNLERRDFSAASYQMIRVPSLNERKNLWVGIYPVTNRQYKEFCQTSGHPKPKSWEASEPDPDKPVVGVSLVD